MPYSKETIRAHGQILVDFANAENTDEACLTYFKNIQSFFNFSPKFDKQIKKNFPLKRSFTESMNESEKNLLELIINEKSEVRSLNHQFEMLGYIFEGCDPQNRKLLLSTYHLEGGLAGGEPDVNTTIDGPYAYSFEELRDDIERNLHPDVPKDINELMKIEQSILNLKPEITGNRFEEIYDISKQYIDVLDLHEKIRVIQKDYRNILEKIIEDTPLNKIPQLDKLIRIYYRMPTTKFKTDGNYLQEIPPIYEANYFRIKSPTGWWITLENELAFCMVEFFRGGTNRSYIKKCHQCKAYYVSKTLAPSTYCSDKCRMAYHNRKRIESGEHARYKRERVASGKATPSYFGPDPNKGKRKIEGKRK